MNNEELKSNLLSSKHWLRLLYMLLFAVILYVAIMVVWVLVVVQFLFSLITGQDNFKIRQFAYSLSTYIYQTLKFLTYSSDEKPFPFADWPVSDLPDVAPTDEPTDDPDVVVEVVEVVEVEIVTEDDPKPNPDSAPNVAPDGPDDAPK